MSHEIEVKLAVSAETFHHLAPYLQQLNPLERRSIFLSNTYYDYPDHFLAKQKMGLRIRQEDEKVTLTLKTNGKVVGGLHARPEYNLSLAENKTPTHQQLRQLYPFEQLPDAPLQRIFSTDFNRTFWLLPFREAQIEVAFDQGEIISGDRSQLISEIEFELKAGSIQDLLDFIEPLPFADDVYFSSTSKAQRGYQLSKPTEMTDWLNKWRDFLQEEREESAVDFKEKFNALLRMEQTLVEETLSLPSSLFDQDFMKTVERVSAFFNLYHYYDENKKWLEAVTGEKDMRDTLVFLLENNQYFLAEIQTLIRFHSETKDNEKTIEKLTALFKTKYYFERMLKLMRLAV